MAEPKLIGTSRTFGQHVIFSSDNTKDLFSSDGIIGKQGEIQGSTDKIIDIVRDTEESQSSLIHTSTTLHSALSERISDFKDESLADLVIAAVSNTDTYSVSMPASTSNTGQTFSGFSNVAQNFGEQAVVLGSPTKTQEELREILLESKKVDLSITLKSIRSEPVQFSTIQVPKLDIKFIYNHFIPEESNIQEQEDLSKDPFLTKDIYNVPRYVELEWESVNKVEPLQEEVSDDPEVKKLKRDLFYTKRGFISSANEGMKNNVSKANKRFNLIGDNGLSFQITDVHNIQDGFNAIVNKRKYKNTLSTIINTNGSNSVPVSIITEEE